MDDCKLRDSNNIEVCGMTVMTENLFGPKGKSGQLISMIKRNLSFDQHRF